MNIPNNYLETVGVAIFEHCKKTDETVHGWVPSWEYPGFLCWNNPDYPDYDIAATPFSDDYEGVPVQVTMEDADFVDGVDVPYSPVGDPDEDVEGVLEALRAAWGKVMVFVHL